MNWTLQSFGVVVRITSPGLDFRRLIDERLPAFPTAPQTSSPQIDYRVVRVGADGPFGVLRGRRTLRFAPDLVAAADILVSDLQTTLARAAAGWTFIHAGVVAIGGGALLLPGRSGAGKSTLVAALVREGAEYGSDEFAVLNAAGCVFAYSRDLALRVPDRGVVRVRLSQLGARTVSDGTPVRAVLFTEFQAAAPRHLRPLSQARVVLGLLQHCLGVRGRPTETLRALARVAVDARGLTGARGEADDLARDLIAQARNGWRSECF